MKKLTAFIIAFSLISGIFPFTSFADDTETGIMDTSDISFQFGELENAPNLKPQAMEILAGESSDDYLLGSHLDKNNKAVYDAMAAFREPSPDPITVILPETVTFQTADIENDEDKAFYNAVFGASASGMQASSFDRPEIFWLDQNEVTVSTGGMRYTYDYKTGLYTFTIDKIVITPAKYESFESYEEIEEYKEKLDETVSTYDIKGETRAEKLRSIHDSICLFTDYDLNGKFSGSAISALVEPGSVCEGYAKGFKLLCDSQNIPCVCVFGNLDETGIAHMWNYVQMDDGEWYGVDITWDDYDGKYGYDFIDDYFLKGSDSFNEKHTEFNDFNMTHLEYPQIVEWNYGEGTTTVPTEPTTDETEYPYGDLNHDNTVSIADLVCCASFVLFGQETEYSCDVNDDGTVDVFDVVIMRKIVTKSIHEKQTLLDL